MRNPILLLLLLLASTDAFAMRCGSRLVDDGAQDFQVRDRCGEPYWIDGYSNVEIIGAHGPLEQQREVRFDVWYYNFGPRQLLRRLTFRDGVLIAQDALGYGVDEIGHDCHPNRVLDGMSAGELVARCGEPASRRNRSDAIVHRPRPGIELWRDQRREEWVYDFGGSSLVRLVQLVDGRVIGVDRVRR